MTFNSDSIKLNMKARSFWPGKKYPTGSFSVVEKVEEQKYIIDVILEFYEK
mgnify:CR=1 FL=1